MTVDSRVTIHKGAAALIGLALLLAGAGASYLLMRSSAETASPRVSVAESPPSTTARPEAPLPDVVVSLTTAAVERAGIVARPVATGTSAGEIRLPGIVEPHAYRHVAVTPLVAGRVTRVAAGLGASVRRGQTLAEIYSPDLAEAQTKYVSSRAMLAAHDRELQRTQKLVEIGAASRQELERIHAEHATQTATVQSARSQLELLGVSASAIDALESGGKVEATTTVPAPIDGVVTERTANVGLNVNQGTPLFTVVDLSTVWIIADVHEKDLSRARVGNNATVVTAAYPGLSLRGNISYLDPRVSLETRTAKLRVEVPNPRGELRLGMFVDLVVTGSPGASRPVVPSSAVQNVGARTVVYLANPEEPGRFTEREIRLGDASKEHVEVVAGLQAGDVVVTEGSFFLRAEVERLGLRPAPAGVAASPSRPPARSTTDAASVQVAKVIVNEEGFEPAKVMLRAGAPARLTFIRTTDKTCATEVVFHSLTIKRTLPLNEPVVVEFTPATAEEIAFTCGMNMLRGAVVVR